MTLLPYDPGTIPEKPAPQPGERLVIELTGLPPYKQVRQSLRNANHPRRESFVKLRTAATRAMAGRAWYRGPVRLDLIILAPQLPAGRSVLDYMAGIMDTLDGSHGSTFTYLPIVYEDDCQVSICRYRLEQSNEEQYRLDVEFL